MNDFALSFTTELAPAEQFQVDGAAYDILGLDHLSAEEEAEVTALFARFTVLAADLANTANVEKGKALALKVSATRLQLLCKLTSLTPEIASKLHVTQQVKLLEAIEAGVQADYDAADGE